METRSDVHGAIGEREPLIIRRVDAIPLGLPLSKPVAMAGATVRQALNILVRIESADGTIGWGEAASAPTMTGDTLGSLLAAVRDHLGPLLIGQDAWTRPALCRKLKRALFGNTGAHSAIEVALLDLAGRSSGLPIVDLIGGPMRGAVAPMWLLGNPTPEQDIAEAHAKRAQGFGFFKLKIGTKAVDSEIASTLALRNGLGAATPLCADANCGLTLADACRYVEGVREAGLLFIEQPLAHADLNALARLTRISAIPIGADEGIHSLADIEAHERCGAGGGVAQADQDRRDERGGRGGAAVPAPRPLCQHRRKDRGIQHRVGRGDPSCLRRSRGGLGREPHSFLSRRRHCQEPAGDRRRRGRAPGRPRARH